MSPERGSGEAAERANRQRWIRMMAAGIAIAAVTGFVMAYGGSAPALDGSIPVWAAAAVAAAWLALMAYGVWYYETQVDEVERDANHFGYAVGAGLLLVLYPVWYLLWWAGLAGEPTHEILTGLLIAGAFAGYLWKKYR